ncbi:MAG: hypothetical protein IEMM0001_2299 [bacterium]|nr:MAG: hypothetical protein IEMM0001_2299 [bacterium]
MSQLPDPTTLALDRTVLANERTYAAWIRTGLTSLATGLGIARFLSDTMPLWSIHTIAAILILFSAASFFLSAWRYQHLHVGMAHLDVKMIPLSVVNLSSSVLIVCSFIALIGLWYIAPIM